MTKITILSSEIFADLRSAGWLESEINPDGNLHRRHEIADICERDNIDRVWRILGTATAMVRLTLRSMTLHAPTGDWSNELEMPEQWVFVFRRRHTDAVAQYIKEKIHEYLVATVLSDRLKVLLPEESQPWEEKERNALLELSTIASAYPQEHPVRRRLSPL